MNPVKTLHIRTHRAPWNDDVEVLLFANTVLGGKAVVEPLTFRNVDAGAAVMDPTFRLSNDDSQAFMDELYRIGFRPTDARSSAGQLQAMQANLEDLRAANKQLLAYALAPQQVEYTTGPVTAVPYGISGMREVNSIREVNK